MTRKWIHTGGGRAAPTGESLVAPEVPVSVELTADTGFFIADVQTNGVVVALPQVLTTQTLSWASLAGNLEVRAVFSPMLEEGAVPTNWLAQYGLTNQNWMSEASLDPDSDALLTWQEYEVGSNPTNPADAQLVVSFVAGAPPHTEWRLTWQAFTNESVTYDILSTSNLTEGFTLFTNLPATPPAMTSPPLPAAHFYYGLRRP